MANSEEEGLKHIFPQLVARLQASDIIDQLYQNSLLTDSEYAVFYKDIHQNPDFRHVNRGILMAVKKGQKGSITRFEEILRTSQPDLAQELRRGKAHSDQLFLSPATHRTAAAMLLVC